jgi:hypothetical protein
LPSHSEHIVAKGSMLAIWNSLVEH